MRLSALLVATEPIRLSACHCKECQRQSGSAFGMSMPVKKDSLTGVVTVTGGVQRVGEVEPYLMRQQPHLATGRLLRL